MRKSDFFLIFFSLCLLLSVATVADVCRRKDTASVAMEKRSDMVRKLGLTDLALFTEARYTRHISQSDLHSAFQDHPMSFEHFPSGSIYLPPQALSQ